MTSIVLGNSRFIFAGLPVAVAVAVGSLSMDLRHCPMRILCCRRGQQESAALAFRTQQHDLLPFTWKELDQGVLPVNALHVFTKDRIPSSSMSMVAVQAWRFLYVHCSYGKLHETPWVFWTRQKVQQFVMGLNRPGLSSSCFMICFQGWSNATWQACDLPESGALKVKPPGTSINRQHL